MILNTLFGKIYSNTSAKLKITIRNLLAAILLIMSFLLGQSPAFATTAAPPFSWGYLTKIGSTFSKVGDVVGVDYPIYIQSGTIYTDFKFVVPYQSGTVVNCTPSLSGLNCEVRYTLTQADITAAQTGFRQIDLDAYVQYKINGQLENLGLYNDEGYTATDNRSPKFAYRQPAPVFTPQTISHNIPAGPVSLGAGTLAVSLSSTSGIGVDASTTNSDVCSISKENNVVTGIYLSAAGSCVVNITAFGGVAGGLNYSPAYETVTFTITPASNTITFAQPDDQSLGSNVFVLNPAPSSSAYNYGAEVGILSTTPNVCYPSPPNSGRIELYGVGTCTLTAFSNGYGNFETAQSVTRSFKITPIANVITFDALSDKTTLDPAFQISASASSRLDVSFSTNSTACSVSGDMVTLRDVGSCAITAYQSGNAKFASAEPVTQTFSVTQPPNIISFSKIADKTFGDAPFMISASATSNLPVVVSSSAPNVCTISGATVTMIAAGKCQLLGKQAGDSTYPAAADETVSFEVNKATATATLDPITGPIFATQTITLTARVTGQSPTGNVDFRLNKNTIATVALTNGVATTTYTTTIDGDHYFYASYSGDNNNAKSSSNGLTVTVDARPADASQSASTRSGIQAQNQATQRYASSQNNNVASRLQNTRNPDTENSFAVQLQFEGAPQVAGLAAAGQQMTGFGKGNLPFGMWVGGTVGFGSQDNSTSGVDKFHTSGLTIGFDHRVSDALLLGVALGIAVDETKIGTDGSEVEGENFSGSLYASYRTAPSSYIDLLVGYGAGDLQTSRYDTLGAVMLHGDRDTSQFFGSLAFTYERKIENLTFAPYLKARAEHTTADAYAETGSPIWALAYDDMSSTSVNAVVGFDARFDIPVSWGTLVATGGAEYSTQVAGNYNQGVGYADGAGGAFTITDAGTSASQFTTSAGLGATVDQLTLDVLYKYSLANHDAKSHAISGTVRYEF